MEPSTGEAILIIDRLADFMPELLRYRKRIAGYYRISGDRLEPQIDSVRLPKRFGDVLLSFAGPDFIPASSLAALGRVAMPAYAKLNLPNTAGHGGIVLGHLLDLVPEQPLVLLDTGSLFSIPPEICQLGIDSQRLVAATAHNATIATSHAEGRGSTLEDST